MTIDEIIKDLRSEHPNDVGRWRRANLAADEIERLRAAIIRIDAINDNPACFNKEINDLCDPILRPHLSQQERKN